MTTGNGSTKSSFWTVPAMLIVLLLHTGCASTSIHEMNAIQQNIAMLHERVQALERRVESGDGQSQKRADLYSRLEELQVKMGALNGRIEEQNHKIEQLGRTAAQPPPAAASATAQPSPPPAATPSAPQGSPPVKPASEPQPSITIPEKVDQEKTQFDKASQAFQQGQFDTARKEYQAFLARYPKSPLADGAVYSIGECYFSEKRYQDAVEYYQQVVERYPKGSKVPQALLKQGTAFQQMGDATAARILYERLVERYPDTPQAQAAQKKLKQLQ